MSYTAMYRKFRPDNFEDVKGQEHIVKTLKNQINADRIGHAYLFCGTRGTGKTTIAKIFAKAVNCENKKDGSPCNECPTCKAINSGASMNVIEIDAASNNGVDNIREIRDEVQYSPTEGRFKVYIIDEVHMLSIGAFNALLKTLEEPPSYVIFILATTEAHKIPVTIMSRCQRYDFKRISVETITDRLKELTAVEGIQVEDRALAYIAKAADGAMRDALSLLDQCVAFYMGQTLTYDDVLEVLGAVDTTVFSSMLQNVIAGDAMRCIHLLEEIIMQGRDLSQFITDFTWYLRNLMLIKTSEACAEMIDMSSERLEILKAEAAMTDIDSIMRYIRILSELSGQLKYATGKRVLVEIGLIKLTKPAMESDMTSVMSRLAILEDKLEKGVVAVAPSDTRLLEKTVAKPIAKPIERAVPEDIQMVVDNWDKVVVQLVGAYAIHAKRGKPAMAAQGNELVLTYENESLTSSFDKLKDIIENAIEEAFNVHIDIKIVNIDQDERLSDNYMLIKKSIKMPIQVED